MTQKETEQQILLYYKYVKISDPESFKEAQQELCQKLNLKGRIIIAEEGINGTVGGTIENTETYIEELKKDARFTDIHFKKSFGSEDTFPKLSIKVRPEIVTSRLEEEDLDPNKITGKKLSPDELHKWFKENKDFTIIDMRNGYEYQFGHFKNSIDPEMQNFRDLTEKIEELRKHQDKPILTVCTGGVRCEKASGYLLNKGFKDVYQLDGGIVSYMEKYPGEDFLGSLFVFDNRHSIHFEEPENHKIISKCIYCEEPTEKLKNCAYRPCNKKTIICENCFEKEKTKVCLSCHKQERVETKK